MARERKVEKKRSLRRVSVAALSLTMLLSTGCSRAPSFSILGSFFPAWIVCGAVALLLTGLVRLVFVRIGLEQDLLPLILVYPCLGALFTFTLWLLFFS
ncbi:MAG: hypothetical protein JO033_11830 [Acidobacteriaceae bacterium]|nr:hypothetical protein [Acidobacteriaceae bacterium]MBV9499182.1 hypothetical protein [Acidobacteriaceae bacterium]